MHIPQVGDTVEVLSANGVTEWIPGDVGIILGKYNTGSYHVVIPRISPTAQWSYRTVHLRKIEKESIVNPFKFGDFVTVVVGGTEVDGIVISGSPDLHGDYRVAHNNDYDYFHHSTIKLRTPNVVPARMPDLTMLRAGKITAIKELREATQWSLRDAKNVVEAIMIMSNSTEQGLRSDLQLARERADELERKLRNLYAELDKYTLIDMLMK